jgi:hypothetical protein
VGFRVESYSLGELSRISGPGAVAPSLFWTLPVGAWNSAELQGLWQWFTSDENVCHDYGLLLVRDLAAREETETSVDLASLGASLAELMPTGVDRFVSPSAWRQESPRLLVLSGAYPQPGWGVLVEWPGDARSFDNLVTKTLPQLSDGCGSTARLDIFKQATEAYRHRPGARRRPTGRITQHQSDARGAFHRALEGAAQLQWEIGPPFLVMLEEVCRQQGLWVRSLPWDPARMVGWKLSALEVKLDYRDLETVARELAPGLDGPDRATTQAFGLADGSYFTDYVHYVAMSREALSPRAVTLQLVGRLLRPTEMEGLIRRLGGRVPPEPDTAQLAEDLLSLMGWRKSLEVPEKPLASCLITVDGAPQLVGTLSGNDLRIVVESFCKDVLDVVVSKLGYDEEALWRAIQERAPEYRPSSQPRAWEEEVSRLTLGGAAMLLTALGPLGFPTKADSVAELASVLQTLAGLLNAVSHHGGREPSGPEALGRTPSLIRQLLVNAEAILEDLPWHLKVNFVYGDQPKILSGEAWSHGSATPRLLRVLDWTGLGGRSHVTIWNKTRRNPVVTDPVFIARPSRCSAE